MSRSVAWLRQLSRNPWLRRAVRVTLVLVALVFLVNNVVRNWRALSNYEWRFDPARLAAAVICLAFARNFLALASQQAFSGVGYSLHWRTILRGFHLSAFSIYMPGGIYLGRAMVFAGDGVDAVSTTAAVMLEYNMLVLSGLLVSVPYFLHRGPGMPSRWWIVGLVLVPLATVLVTPALINRLLRWLMERLGRKDKGVNLTRRGLANMLLLCVCYWLLGGLGFYLLASSVYPVPSQLLPAAAAAFGLAGAITYTLAFTPGSLGVQEGALALVLTPLLPTPLPAVLALLARLWMTAAFLVLLGLAPLLRRNPQQAKAPVRGRS